MGNRSKRKKILIAGLGNELMCDDGVGIHAVRALGGGLPKGVCTAEVGTSVLDALHLFEWADQILAIDAVAAGGKPGDIYMFDIASAEDQGVKASLHELSLVAALRFLAEADRPSVTVLGVEPEKIDYSLELSPAVNASVERLIKIAKDTVADWAKDTDA